MIKFIFNRLLQLVPLLIGVSMITFALIYIAPGDPIERKLTDNGIMVTQEILEKERKAAGLDKPFFVQYSKWALAAIQGDFGLSYKDGLSTSSKLKESFGYTLLLSGLSMTLAVLIAFPLGIIAAVHRDGFLDKGIRWMSFIGNSVPNFLLCIIVMYIFCIHYKWLPVIAEKNIKGLILPTLSFTLPVCCRLMRQVRSEVLEQLSKPYVISALSRGVKWRYTLYFNALRNALPGLLTITGLAFGALLGGSVVIESIFRWPGVGKLVMDAILSRDYPVVQGFVMITAVLYVFINLLIDVSHKWLDPRIEG